MSDLEAELATALADLTAATDQLERAATGGDWPLVERIQKRRLALIGWLGDWLPATPAPEYVECLHALRARERTLLDQVSERRDLLGQALGQAPGQVADRPPAGARHEPGRRMRRAYRAIDNRH